MTALDDQPATSQPVATTTTETRTAADTLHFQVMWNRLTAVVEEQALALVRTAFSTSVREAGDLSAGVFDPLGWMIAQTVTGTPGDVNAMANAVGHFINDIGPEHIYPGDVYMTNDPWKGTGHLHDITLCTPCSVTSQLGPCSAMPSRMRCR